MRGDTVKLYDLLNGVPLTGASIDQNMEITSISYDSRAVEPGALFAALPGERDDGTTSGRHWTGARRQCCAPRRPRGTARG